MDQSKSVRFVFFLIKYLKVSVYFEMACFVSCFGHCSVIEGVTLKACLHSDISISINITMFALLLCLCYARSTHLCNAT